MPVVPSQLQGISLDVSTANINPNAFGAVGDQLARTGAQIANTATQIFDEIKQQEAHAATNVALNDDRIETEKFHQQLKINSSGGYVLDANGGIKRTADGEYKTISQEYQEWADKRFQDKQLSMPTKYAQQLYTAAARPLYTEKAITINTDQLEATMKTAAQSIDSIISTSGNYLAKNPDIGIAYDSVNYAHSNIVQGKGKLWNGETVTQKVGMAENSISSDLFNGAVAQVQTMGGKKNALAISEADKWLKVLYEQDGDSRRKKEQGIKTVAEMLKPDERVKYIEAFDRIKNLAKANQHSDLNLRIMDLNAKTSGPQTAYDKTVNQTEFTKLYQEVLALPPDKATDYEKGHKITEMLASAEIGDFTTNLNPFKSDADLQKSATAAAANILKKAESITDPNWKNIAGYVTADKSLKEIYRQIEPIMAAKKKDYMDFAKQYEPAIGQAWGSWDRTKSSSFTDKASVIDGAISKAKDYLHYGSSYGSDMSNWRPISKEDSSSLGTLISNSKEPTATAQMIMQIRRMKNGPDLMETMISDKSLPPAYKIVGYQPTVLGVQETLQMLGEGKNEIANRFKGEVLGRRGLNEKDFEQAQPKLLGQFIQESLVSHGMSKADDQNMGSIVELIKTKAQKNMLMDISASPQDAWNKAADSLLGRHIYMNQIGEKMLSIPKNAIMSTYVEGGVEKRKLISDPENDQITRFARELKNQDFLKQYIPDSDIPRDVLKRLNVPESAFVNLVAKTGQVTVSPTTNAQGVHTLNISYEDRVHNIKPFILKQIPLQDAAKKGYELLGQDKGANKQFMPSFMYMGR